MRYAALLLGLVLGACGSDPYGEVLEEQYDVMDEVLDVIEGVEDAESAKAAAEEIDALAEKLAVVQKRIRLMDDPTPEQRRELSERFTERELAMKERTASFRGTIWRYPCLHAAVEKIMQMLPK